MAECIVRKPHIWDLHIHTPLGTPTKKNYGGIAAEQFVDELLNVYSTATNTIDMISFTDHNQMNVEAYNIFRTKTQDIAVIPGIEVDIYLTTDAPNSKHIIFYFPESELDHLSELNILITSYIEKCQGKVIFDSFVDYLLRNHKRFAISPHAFKQGKRGINLEWTDPEATFSGVTGFSGLFFPFWEAAGKSDIMKAREFLDSEYSECSNEQSVIAFSDSADYEKVKSYINAPHQFFLCLDSFQGLLLAGSDPSRIIYTYEERPSNNPAEKIKSITLKDPLSSNGTVSTIDISDRLNVIIGGRGKGKSALLDAIVYSLGNEELIDRSRRSFIKKFGIQSANFNERQITQKIEMVYYSQSFITKLFSGDRSSELLDYFRSQFNCIDTLNDSIVEISQSLEGTARNQRISQLPAHNITDDIQNLRRIPHKNRFFRLANQLNEQISLLSQQDKDYFSALKEILPDDTEVWTEEVSTNYQRFIESLLYSISFCNKTRFISTQFNNIVQKRIEESEKKQSAIAEKHIEGKNRILDKLRSIYSSELQRVILINRLYQVPTELAKLKYKVFEQNGEGENKFFFVIVTNKEHPVEYAVRLIRESVDNRKIPENISPDELLHRYATEPDFFDKLISQVSMDGLFNEISNLSKIHHDKVFKIIYQANGETLDLQHTSPGTQTNAIMECILHSDSSIPLFLDQPEDNIDNEARYKKLTKWIKQQKRQRQIIIVTHDANIVINGDAECVIIAEHDANGFRYKCGALEYADILDCASTILDGGKIAIKRRMAKYGE